MIRLRLSCDFLANRLFSPLGGIAHARQGNHRSHSPDPGDGARGRGPFGPAPAAAARAARPRGPPALPRLSRVLRAAIDRAYGRALASAQGNEAARAQFGSLAETLYSTELAPIDGRQDTVAAQYEIEPRSVSLEEVARYVRETSKA